MRNETLGLLIAAIMFGFLTVAVLLHDHRAIPGVTYVIGPPLGQDPNFKVTWCQSGYHPQGSWCVSDFARK